LTAAVAILRALRRLTRVADVACELAVCALVDADNARDTLRRRRDVTRWYGVGGAA
jgi:hypothetical protein